MTYNPFDYNDFSNPYVCSYKGTDNECLKGFSRHDCPIRFDPYGRNAHGMTWYPHESAKICNACEMVISREEWRTNVKK